MMTIIQWVAGLSFALTGWLATAAMAKVRGVGLAAMAFDGLVPVLAFSVCAGLTGRPLFSGAVVFALVGGIAFADGAKREILREPVLFCDLSELKELVRHPHLYLPYAGTGRILAGACLAVGAAWLLYWFEPPVFFPTRTSLTLAAVAGLALVILPATVLLRPLAGALRRFAPTGDPVADSARLGGLATLFTYGMIARAERRARRATVAPPVVAPAPVDTRGPPVVVVQSESFFDVRRLGKGLFPRALLAFDKAAKSGQSGRMKTPAWGANTVRTEFEAITGIDSAKLGFDRFNPYHAFVRQPVASMAWAMKARGYKTICLHPYDRTFYSRHRVMKHLGFDLFLGREAFAKAPKGAYISDAVLTEKIAALVAGSRQNIFIFVITMENHGPWPGGLGERPDPAPALPDMAQGGELKRFAANLAGANAMITALKRILRKDDGVLAFYGDHLPSLPGAFDALGFTEESTDYLVWRLGLTPKKADLAAHELAAVVIAALDEPSAARS